MYLYSFATNYSENIKLLTRIRFDSFAAFFYLTYYLFIYIYVYIYFYYYYFAGFMALSSDPAESTDLISDSPQTENPESSALSYPQNG